MDGELSAVFLALADPSRRQVMELLSRGPRRAGELARSVGSSPAAMSRHLKMLLRVGLVVDERIEDDARVRQFRLRPQAMEPAADWWAEVMAAWRVQLESYQRHVEQRVSQQMSERREE